MTRLWQIIRTTAILDCARGKREKINYVLLNEGVGIFRHWFFLVKIEVKRATWRAIDEIDVGVTENNSKDRFLSNKWPREREWEYDSYDRESENEKEIRQRDNEKESMTERMRKRVWQRENEKESMTEREWEREWDREWEREWEYESYDREREWEWERVSEKESYDRERVRMRKSYLRERVRMRKSYLRERVRKRVWQRENEQERYERERKRERLRENARGHFRHDRWDFYKNKSKLSLT